MFTITADRVALACLAAGALVVMSLAVIVAEPHAPVWPVALLAVAAFFALTEPDGNAPLLVLAVYAVWWLAGVPEAPLPWALAGAAGTLVLHLCFAHAAAVPPGARLEGRVTTSLVLGGLAVLALTACLVGAMALVRAGELHTGPVVLAVALALLGVLAWIAAPRRPE